MLLAHAQDINFLSQKPIFLDLKFQQADYSKLGSKIVEIEEGFLSVLCG
jgi:hypothetical protein